MPKKASSGGRAADSAIKILNSEKATKSEKDVAAAALAGIQSGGGPTSSRIATAAAKILRDPKANKDAKTAAASALIQKPHFEPKNVKSQNLYRAVASYLARQKARTAE